MFAMINEKTNKLYTTFAALNSVDMRTTKKTSHQMIKGKEVNKEDFTEWDGSQLSLV